MKNLYYYIGENPTCDLVIINHKKEILLVTRSDQSPACPGMPALPGGFIDSLPQPKQEKIQDSYGTSNNVYSEPQIKKWIPGLETAKQAAKRELKEETHLDITDAVILPVGTYVGNQRDPRDNDISWSKSHVFYYEISKELFEANKDIITGADPREVSAATWTPVVDILEMDMAFDHKKIIIDALLKYQPELMKELSYSPTSIKFKR